EVPSVDSMPGHSGRYLVAFHHRVLDNARKIREHVMHHGHPVLDSDTSRSLSRHCIVVNHVFGDQAIKRGLIGRGDRPDDRVVGLSETPLAHPNMLLPLATAHQSRPRTAADLPPPCPRPFNTNRRQPSPATSVGQCLSPRRHQPSTTIKDWTIS